MSSSVVALGRPENERSDTTGQDSALKVGLSESGGPHRGSAQSTLPELGSAQSTSPNSTGLDSSGKLRFLEGIRGLAALYVVLGHLCTMVDPSIMSGRRDGSPPWMQSFVSGFGYGHVAVAIFIVISGFSLQLSLFSNGDGRIAGLGRFYLRRAQRILPTYYACLGLSVLVGLYVTPILLARYGDPFAMYLPIDGPAIWSHVFLIHNWWPSEMYKINGVLWSIGVESQLYLVFPLLVFGVFRLGRASMIAATTIAAFALLVTWPESTKLYPWYVPLFVVGMAAAHYGFRPNLRGGVHPVAGLIVCVLTWSAGVAACWLQWALPVRDGFFGFGAAALMYSLLVCPPTFLTRTLGAAPLSFLGSFSYSLYLMHHPVEQVVYLFKPTTWSGPTALGYQFLISLPVILIATWVFSLVFERPFMPRRRGSRKAPFFGKPGAKLDAAPALSPKLI